MLFLNSDHFPIAVSLKMADLNTTMNATSHGNFTTPHEPTPEELRHAMLAFYIVMFCMVGAQAGLVSWRKKHRQSYELTTLLGLWLVPPVLALHVGFWRFLLVWTSYSVVTLYYIYQCTFSNKAAAKIDKSLPKRVYRWFYWIFRFSVGIGALGYFLLLTDVFGLGMLSAFLFGPGSSLLFLWYGLYFGILTRDCAEVASDRIAAALGTGRKMAVSVRDCGICGGELTDAHSHIHSSNDSNSTLCNSNSNSKQLHSAEEDHKQQLQKTVQLSCKHLFHGECIRGWLIIGKKDTCPTCWEKVDTKKLYGDRPWETTNLSWVQMLDMVRYLVAWNPMILFALHFILHFLHLDDEEDGGGMMLDGSGNGTEFGGNDTDVTLMRGRVGIDGSATM